MVYRGQNAVVLTIVVILAMLAGPLESTLSFQMWEDVEIFQ